MQQLADALTAAPNELANEPPGENLTKAAAEWASFAVLHFSDPLLEPALAISVAISRFTHELQNLKHKNS